MSKLDDAIRDALSEEDAEFLARFERDPPVLAEAFGIFLGRNSWFNLMFLAAFIPVAAFGVYAAWKFATLEELRAMLHWGAIMGFCLVVVALIRLWFFMEIHTRRVMREIKRLELQVARLTAREMV
jgi:NADH:ubiquinone oxidoreductase subunit 6 (subunit J)